MGTRIEFDRPRSMDETYGSHIESKQWSYDNYIDWKPWDASSFGKPDVVDYYDGEVERAVGKAHGSRSLRLVEIGFGNGHFLGWARLRGHSVVGIELIEELNQRAKAAGFETAPSIDALVSTNASAYDLVAAFDVLEHIEPNALVEFLIKIHALLCPGGVLLARFPNGDSPFGLRYQHGDLTHRTILGEGAVNQLLARTPFRSHRLYGPYLEYKGLGGFAKKAIKWPIQFCLERVLRHLYYGVKMPPSLAMNYILVASK